MQRGKNHSQWWNFLLIALVAATAVGAIHFLNARADHAYEHELLLANFREAAARMSILEWQAVATRGEDARVFDEFDRLRDEIEQLMVAHKEFTHSSENSVATSDILYTYFSATSKEFSLLKAGDLEEALRVDTEEVDPLFEQMNELSAQEAEELHDAYERANTLSFAGTVATVLGAVSLIHLLMLRFSRKQRSEQRLIAEKSILEESEERFRAVAQSAPDAVISINSIGRITFWNRQAERMFGFTVEEAAGQLMSQIMPERFCQQFKEVLDRIVTGAQPRIIGQTVEVIGQRKDGSQFPIELSLSSWVLAGEQYFTSVLRDVSDHKEMENQLRFQRAELEERNVQLWALYEVSSIINNEEQLDILFDKVLAKLTSLELFDVERRGGIFLVEGDDMRLAAWLDHTDAFLRLHNNMKTGTCLCGIAAETGETIVSTNSESDSRHHIRYPDMTPHGHVVVPLKSANNVPLGVLYLYLPAGAEMPDYDRRLLEAIGNQLAVAIERDRLFMETRRLSLHDPLTGLANRNLMNVELTRNFARMKRTREPFSVLMLDLDHFKKYNDTFGHTAGDNLLKDVARIMLEELREIDLAVRYGGEEFLIMLPDTAPDRAAMVAERIRLAIERTDFYHAESAIPAHITVSIGVTSTDNEAPNEDVLVSRSDNALYQAKNSGRNRVETWSPES